MIYILDEIKYAEKILSDGFENDEIGNDLKLLSRYYYHYKKKPKEEIRKLLESFVDENNSDHKIMDHKEIFDVYVKEVEKYPICQIEYIEITESEIEAIQTIDNMNTDMRIKVKREAYNKNLKKLLFTLLVVAKFNDIKFERNDHKVMINSSNDLCDIFKLANIDIQNIRPENRDRMLYKLFENNLITRKIKVNDLNWNVCFVENNSPTVLKITNMDDLGYQYLQYKGHKFYNCKKCGKLCEYRKNAKYCSDCAKYTPMGVKTKICVDCGVEFETTGKDNRSDMCDDCRLKYRREYWRKNKEKQRKTKK